MMKDVVISIRTVHCCDTDEEDYLDFTTDGLYGYDGEVGCLSYMEGEKSSLLYNTPYGTATMNISTRRISHSLDGSGGQVDIDYVVDMEHTVVTKNRFHLEITEQKQMGENQHG